MDTTATWEPLAAPYDGNGNGKLDARERRALPDAAFAFPRRRELPLVDAEHTRAAAEKMDRVVLVTDEERRLALANVRLAATHFGVELPDRVRHARAGGERP